MGEVLLGILPCRVESRSSRTSGPETDNKCVCFHSNIISYGSICDCVSMFNVCHDVLLYLLSHK